MDSKVSPRMLYAAETAGKLDIQKRVCETALQVSPDGRKKPVLKSYPLTSMCEQGHSLIHIRTQINVLKIHKVLK